MSLDLAAAPLPPGISPLPLSPHDAPYVHVILERATAGIEGELTYAWPAQFDVSPQIGLAVALPLRFGRAVGYVVGSSFKTEFDPREIKAVEAVLAPAPFFDDLALKIARWMASYYHCGLSECLALLVPAGATPELEAKWSFCAPDPLRALRDLSRTPKLFSVAEALWKLKKPLTIKEISKFLDGASVDNDTMRRLSEIGVVQSVTTSRTGVKAKLLPAVRLTESGRALLEIANIGVLEKKAPKQAFALKIVAQMGRDWIACGQLLRESGV